MKKRLNFLKKVLLSNFSRLKLPYKLTLMLTYRCNFKCRMCNIWKFPLQGELTPEELRTFFKKNRFSWVNISGGEIFAREDHSELLDAIINECKNLYILNFPTNGYFSEETVKFVRKVLRESSVFLGVTVSLDGTAKSHDSIRGKEGAWQHALTTYCRLKEIKDTRLHVKIGFTIQPYNLEEFPAMYCDLAKKIPGFGFKDVHINMYHYSTHYYGTAGSYDDKQRTDLLESFKRISKMDSLLNIRGAVDLLDYLYRRLIPYYIKKKRRPILCQALRGSCFVDPYWNIYPCSSYNLNLGNLKDHDFSISGIWKIRNVIKSRNDILSGRCPHCWTPCEAYQSILSPAWKIFLRAMR